LKKIKVKLLEKQNEFEKLRKISNAEIKKLYSIE
jgi:hypothetical protein